MGAYFGYLQLKVFSSQVVSSIFGGSFMSCPTGNSTIYEAAAQFLAEDVVFGADVLHVDRDKKGVTVTIDTPHGRQIVKAKKLVVTAPPTQDTLCGLDLDASTRHLERQIRQHRAAQRLRRESHDRQSNPASE